MIESAEKPPKGLLLPIIALIAKQYGATEIEIVDRTIHVALLFMGEPIMLPRPGEYKKWSERTAEEKKSMKDPIAFKDLHWGKFIDRGLMYQADMDALDPSLKEAIKSHCRHRGLNPLDHLPPPSPSRKERFERRAAIIGKLLEGHYEIERSTIALEEIFPELSQR